MSDESHVSRASFIRASSLRASIAVDAPRSAFDYTGRASDLAKIVAVNFLLGLLTLGIYRFWGKTRLRRYFWSHVSFEGEPLEYTGRAMEIFLGFLIVIAILVPVGAVLGLVDYAMTGMPELRVVSNVVQIFVITFLIYVALFRARRYRLTRTLWRGIRGGQTGSSVRYALLAIGWLFATALTLGLAYPVMQTRLQGYLIGNTWFGSQSLSFDGEAKDLFRRWLIAWLLLIPTVGVSWVWYQVQAFRYFVGQTRYGNLSFTSELSFARVFWILAGAVVAVIAMLLLVGTILQVTMSGVNFGELSLEGKQADSAKTIFKLIVFAAYFLVFVFAVSVVRIAVVLNFLVGEVCNSLWVSGEENYDAIRQSAEEQPRFGEGLADALDVGSI